VEHGSEETRSTHVGTYQKRLYLFGPLSWEVTVRTLLYSAVSPLRPPSKITTFHTGRTLTIIRVARAGPLFDDPPFNRLNPSLLLCLPPWLPPPIPPSAVSPSWPPASAPATRPQARLRRPSLPLPQLLTFTRGLLGDHVPA
jgi:hypothetical protein